MEVITKTMTSLSKAVIRMGKHKIDLETIVVCGMIAAIAAIGITALFGLLLGIQIVEVGGISICGIIFGLAGIIWGVLMIFNIN